MISHEHRCIFVHIPKTAGNSVNRVFGIGWQDHKDLQRYRDELPAEDFASYFKFAIVRNPWDRLLSDYNYQLKKSRDKDSKLFLFTAAGSRRNFAEWIDVALSEPDYYDPSRWGGSVSAHIHRWSPQCDWMSVEGQPAVDYVAHLERLSEDFPPICRHLGLRPVHLPHRNRRLHLHYSHYYDATTRAVVASYYARDIELFGFEFRHAFLRVSFAWPMAPGATAGGETPDAHSGTKTRRDGERFYSFPGVWRATARHAWFFRSALALAASVALFVRTFSALPTTDPLGEAMQLSVPQEFIRQSMQRAMTGSSDPAARLLAPLASASRASHPLNHLDFSLEPSPSTFMGFVPTIVSDLTTTPAPVSRRRAVGPPPADTRSGSGRAPRWWWNRTADNFP